MAQRDPPDAVSEALQEVLPAVTRCIDDGLVVPHLVYDAVHDAVEQRLTSGHVSVERHRLDVQAFPELAHRQTRQALVVDERDGGIQDALPAQRDAGRRRLVAGDDGLVGVRLLLCHVASSRSILRAPGGSIGARCPGPRTCVPCRHPPSGCQMTSAASQQGPEDPGTPSPSTGSPPVAAERDVDTERPVGWYRDPGNPRRHRYWDGAEWGDPSTAPTV